MRFDHVYSEDLVETILSGPGGGLLFVVGLVYHSEQEHCESWSLPSDSRRPRKGGSDRPFLSRSSILDGSPYRVGGRELH